MSKKGGKAIASGSDGCVFDGRFAEDGTFTKDLTNSIVTKVYTGEKLVKTASEEYSMMEKARVATNGVGVVVSSEPPKTIAEIPENAWEDSPVKSTTACKRAFENQAGPFSGLVSPRISGTLIDLLENNRIPLPPSAFKSLNTAIAGMSAGNLCHMDFAARNIFYDETDGQVELLLGDFGNTISLSVSNDEFDKSIQSYIKKYNFEGKFLASMMIDGVTPITIALLVGYDALLKGKAAFDTFIESLRTGQLLSKTTAIVSNTWVYKSIFRRARTAEAVEALLIFAQKLETQYAQIIRLFSNDGKTFEIVNAARDGIRGTLKKQLLASDRRLLKVIEMMFTKTQFLAGDIQSITDTWFPEPVKTGGKKVHRIGGVQDISLKSLIFKDVPTLYTDYPQLKTGTGVTDTSEFPLNSSGGRRRTRRKRAKRVKISRKHK